MDFRVSKGRIIIDASLKLYPLEAIYGACYSFLDRAFVYLDQTESGKVRIFLKAREEADPKQLQSLAGEMANSLLHQTLRLRIAKRTGQVRDMVVGRALLSAEPAGFAEEEDDFFDSADYLDDPLGIAVPWEEKYGQSEEKQPDEKAETEQQTGDK